MLSALRPALRPLPLIGASGLLLAATLSSRSSRPYVSAATSMTNDWPVKQYEPRHTSWPYNASDFTRMDSSADDNFYSQPRFVTHIDDAAIASLREYYDRVLPRKGRILDFCSSWVSHYPASIERAVDSHDLKVTGMGINKAELAANQFLNAGRILVDLNQHPDINAALLDARAVGSTDDERLDASTCVVSIDYLTQPVEVLESLLKATKPGGKVHLTISNRCFPTKAMSRWLRVSETERLEMVGDFLHFAGWKQIEIVELSNGTIDPAPAGESSQQPGGLQGLMSWMGMNSRDPLWIVRAVKQ